jgi:YidC/Oxa1 family membrane protein insertase
MIQHYFIAAWTGDEGQANHVYTKATANDQFVVGMVANPTQVAAGQTATIKAKMFVGPKLQNELEALAPHLELTVDYGWLTVLAKPIYWLMKQIHGLLGNWGWSIIILTLLIKLVFYKLSETSYRSMARMRKMQPRLQQLKERFGDDKQGMQQAMMKLYKEEKINPFGGCLPILIQIPVFIALYWVLLESVELRQAPFVLWIKDLSTPDPYFVLPIVMGVTMILQQKLNPSPLDEMQKKIMMMLPIMFTVFFLFFPAGLVLYWTANNILSIAQQWVITKRVTEGKG